VTSTLEPRSPARLHPGPFILASAVSLALVLSAPFVGQIRGELRRAFPGQFVTIVGGVIAAGVIAALLAALLRIRDRRLVRYGTIALALLIAVAYSTYRAGPNPESNAVERFHFLQYGLITYLFYRAWRPLGDASIFVLPVFAGLIVGTVEEWFQWFIPNRIGEMNDVFLNLVAIGTGLLFSIAVDPPEKGARRLQTNSGRRITRMGAAALAVFAAFFHIVHLGYRVDDEEIGSFTSRWTASELLQVQDDKRAQWLASPPSVILVRLSREEQYLSEGIEHVQERNERWTAGDIRGAWLENRILEKYYEPVLDTPTHAGAGHRWPPEQRTDAESRAASAASAPFTSNAYPYRLFLWPKVLFWLVIAAFTGAILVAGRRTAAAEFRITARNGD
jgi:VanZ family protein